MGVRAVKRHPYAVKTNIETIPAKPEETECEHCNGTGYIRHPRFGRPSCPSEEIHCPECDGAGIIDQP